MQAPNFQGLGLAADAAKVGGARFALVNGVFAKALGLSARGVLRPEQTFAELSPAEREGLVDTLTRRYERSLDAFGRPVYEVAGPSLGVTGGKLAGRLRAARVHDAQTRLRPLFAALRAGTGLLSLYRGALEGAIRQVELDLEGLAAGLEAEAEADRIEALTARLCLDRRPSEREVRAFFEGRAPDPQRGALSFVAGLADLATITAQDEKAAVALREVETQIRAISAAFQEAPLTETSLVAERCERAVEEAIADFEDAFREVGLTDYDLRPLYIAIDAATQQPTDELDVGLVIDEVRAEWAGIIRLAGGGGRSQLEAARRRAAAIADRATALRDVEPEDFERLGVSEEDAETIHARLQRVVSRVESCAAALDEAMGATRPEPRHPLGGGSAGPGGGAPIPGSGGTSVAAMPAGQTAPPTSTAQAAAIATPPSGANNSTPAALSPPPTVVTPPPVAPNSSSGPAPAAVPASSKGPAGAAAAPVPTVQATGGPEAAATGQASAQQASPGRQTGRGAGPGAKAKALPPAPPSDQEDMK